MNRNCRMRRRKSHSSRWNRRIRKTRKRRKNGSRRRNLSGRNRKSRMTKRNRRSKGQIWIQGCRRRMRSRESTWNRRK